MNTGRSNLSLGVGVRPGFVQGSFVGYNSFRTKSLQLDSASALKHLQISGKRDERGAVWP